MRRIHLKSFFWLFGMWTLLQGVGCAHQASTVSPKGFEAARSTRAQLKAGLEPRRWAVVVGINDFLDPTFDDLKHAEDDAREAARVLSHPRYGGFDRVFTLIGREQTSRDAILFELGRLRDSLRRQDTLVLYFSGHGTMEFSEAGEALLYLVAQDTRADDLWGTGIELGALRRFLSTLKPQHKILILDSCFAGAGKSRWSASVRDRVQKVPDLWQSLSATVGQSEAILMASTMGGVALEDDELGHGTYSYYLFQAMTTELLRADVDGDGAVSAYEAHDYARGMTMRRTDRKQAPEGYFRVIGQAELYLSGEPDPARAEEAALVYAYNDQGHSGLSLEIDGRSKGTFPRTVAVEAGRRQVVVRDADGHPVAQGRLSFAKGQTYSVGLLMDELKGYRRFFGVSTGGTAQLTGPVSTLWGEMTPRLGVTSGYRVRGGLLRGLALSFHGGWRVGRAELGDGVDSQPTTRLVLDAGTSLVLRRSIRKVQGGLGWHATATYVGSLGGEDPVTSAGGVNAEDFMRTQPWLVLSGGPVLWSAYALMPAMLLVLEARSDLSWGNYSGTGISERNSDVRVNLGIELGF